MSDLQLRFEEFHENNPHIYEKFCKYSFEALRAGKDKFSAWLVTNRIRWDEEVHTKTDEKFKISNDFIALYARKFMKDHPQHQGFFRIRPMKRV